jgi:hypothetical protein
MKRARRYYVIHEGGRWKVKLENGPVLSTHGSGRREAIAEAKRLGRNQNRPVMVNYKDGRTGAAYFKASEL